MKEISKEFFRIYRSVIFQMWGIVIVCAAAFAVSGAFKGENSLFAVIVCGIFASAATALTVIILTSPGIFEAKLKKCPKEVQREISAGKFVALGTRRFYENHLLFYSRRKINLVSYDEIKSVEIKSVMKMELTLESGKRLCLPTNHDENSAVIAAAFKSKNPKIKFIINGKTIENIDVRGQGK